MPLEEEEGEEVVVGEEEKGGEDWSVEDELPNMLEKNERGEDSEEEEDEGSEEEVPADPKICCLVVWSKMILSNRSSRCLIVFS